MFTQLLLFYLAIFLTLFFPGYFLLKLLFCQNYQELSSLEKLLLTFILSLFSIDFLMISMNFLHIAITRKHLLIGIFGISFAFKVIHITKNKLHLKNTKKDSPFFGNDKFKLGTLQNPSYRQNLLFFAILGISIFLRLLYISEGIFPKTTDLGHHTYWMNYISVYHTLPNYSEKFIIGEHLPFAAIQILSGISYLSPIATISLFLFNIFTLIGVFVLSYNLAIPFNRFFQRSFPKIKKISNWNIALWSLFAIGVLYPITSPQAKFVSGGVIGNVIGNLLIIVAIYSFFQIIVKKSLAFTKVFLFTVFALLYTHHLSAFIFIYSFTAIVFAFGALVLIFVKLNLIKFLKIVFNYLKLFLKPTILLVLLLGGIFLWQIRTPSYLNPRAIDTAVGTPTKITRTGFSISAIINRVGSWRFLFAGIFGIIAFAVLISTFIFKKGGKEKNININLALSLAILFAWIKIIFLMSYKPELLKVDIPSRRIITYLTYPLSITAGFGFIYSFVIIKSRLRKGLLFFLFVFFLGIGLISGLGQDFNENQRSAQNTDKETMETYLASIYLAQNTFSETMILKDHKFLSGDTWMKLFFMRGYKYPLSRTYDRRYEDKYNKHETCTRDMIAKPNSKIGEECFQQTKTKYIVLKKGYDDGIFRKLKNFHLIYVSENVVIYEKQ